MKKVLVFVAIIMLSTGIAIFSAEKKTDIQNGNQKQEQKAKNEDEQQPKLRYTEKIIVTAYRLPAEEVELSNIPASVIVIPKKEIDERGSETVQDLFLQHAGFIVFDQVGNGVESTVDLRGFNEGTTTTVLVDGVRINEPDDNRVNLDLIPIDQIERIEIIKGSSSPIYGEGSMAGSINIITRKGSGRPKLDLGLAIGSFNRRKYQASTGAAFNKFSFLLSGTKDKAEGFRENGFYDKNSIFARLNYNPSAISNINFSYLYNDNSFGNPGALTESELTADRKQAPFNMVDNSNKNSSLITLTYQINLQGKISLSANVFHRKNNIDTLTTGRSAVLWGGFLTNSDITSKGTTLQLNYDEQFAEHYNSLALGFEYTDNEFGADGSITDLQGENPFHISSNFTDQSVKGFFLQNNFNFNRRVIFSLGARYDQEGFNYSDQFYSANDNTKVFSQWSLKAGAVYKIADTTSAFASYSEAFLAPTVIDLFAYPFFGSNPELRPTISKDYEVGIRGSMEDKLTASFTWYRIKVWDEIVYIFDFYTGGKNENIGRSLRQGIEFSFSAKPIDWIDAYLFYTFTDARIKSGENIDNRIPLVPAHKLNLGAKFHLSDTLMLFAEGLRIGEQFLSGDEQNNQNPIEGYTLINTRLSYQVKNLEVWFKVNNLLNQKYSTRGIFVAGQPYFTPAPGISFNVGLKYSFSK